MPGDNPTVPQYAAPAPIPNPNCMGCGSRSMYYPPLVAAGSGGNPVFIRAGAGIAVLDESDSTKWDFTVSSDPETELQAALVLVAKALGVAKSNPILIGTVIDELELSWSYNKPVTSQELAVVTTDPDEDIDAPDVAAGLRTLDIEDVEITGAATVSVTGDDGLGLPTSVDTAQASIFFGNSVAWGHAPSQIGESVDDLQALFESFSKATQTTRAKSLTTTGGENEHFFYLVPARFGEVTFTKNGFPGGYYRLLNVDGELKITLGSGEEETPIELENAAGYTEEYYVYMSEYDNKADSETPTIAS